MGYAYNTMTQGEVTWGSFAHKQARATFQYLVRKEMRSYLAIFRAKLDRLFLEHQTKRAWKVFNHPKHYLHNLNLVVKARLISSSGHALFVLHKEIPRMDQMLGNKS